MKVRCFNGELADRKEVRRIKGDYYKFKDILVIDGARYRCTNPTVSRDLNTGRLTSIVTGRANVKAGIKLHESKRNILLYERLLNVNLREYTEKIFYYEDGIRQGFVKPSDIEKVLTANINVIKPSGSDAIYILKKGQDSDIEHRLKDHAMHYKGAMYDSLSYSMKNNMAFFKDFTYSTKDDLGLDTILDGLTFGGEFETSSGHIPHKLLMELGIAPLRDGSISGYEYTTVPLKSINHLKHIVDVLNARCRVTFKDSLHFHIGNVPRSKSFLLKMFKTAEQLQDELYEMVPSYKKRDTHSIKRRSENYTNPLPRIDIEKEDAINKIIHFLSDGKDDSTSIGVRPHPSDPSGDHKWQIRNRYTAINLVNYIYNDSKTIEFRLHEGTTNPYKAIYWLILNIMIVKYAQGNSMYHINTAEYTLKDVIEFNTMTSKLKPLRDAMLAYVEDRKNHFKNYDTSDIYYEKESDEDKTWKPRIKLW